MAGIVNKVFLAAFIAGICLTVSLSAKDGDIAGKVSSVNKNTKEVVVNSTSGKTLKLGDRIYVRVDGEPVIMKVTFPMMTTSKCKPEKKNDKNIGAITKGLTVYRYEPGIEKAEIEAVNEKLYEGNPIVGTWDYVGRIYETRDYVSGKLTFRVDGTYTNDRTTDNVKGKSNKDSGKFSFDIEKGILDFTGKKGTDMFYGGPLKLWKIENNILYFVYNNLQSGYAIHYEITHTNTAPFKISKEQGE